MKGIHLAIISSLLIGFIATNCLAQQNVGINTTSPDASAALDVVSTTQGVLVPRMTQVQRLAINNPATGLLVWQTDAGQGFYYNSGSAATPTWTKLGAKGETGQGVPPGGATGQVLSKIDGTDFNTHWTTLATGPAGGIFSTRSDDAIVSVSAPNYVDALNVNLEGGKKYWIYGVIIAQKAGSNWATAAYKFTYSGSANALTGILSITYGSVLAPPGAAITLNGTTYEESKKIQDNPHVSFDFYTIVDSQTTGTFSIQTTRATGSTDDYLINKGSYIVAIPVH